MQSPPRKLKCPDTDEPCSDDRCKVGLCVAKSDEPKFIDPSRAYAQRQAEEIDREALEVAKWAYLAKGVSKPTPDQLRDAAARPWVRQMATEWVLAREKSALEPLPPELNKLWRDLPD